MQPTDTATDPRTEEVWVPVVTAWSDDLGSLENRADVPADIRVRIRSAFVIDENPASERYGLPVHAIVCVLSRPIDVARIPNRIAPKDVPPAEVAMFHASQANCLAHVERTSPLAERSAAWRERMADALAPLTDRARAALMDKLHAASQLPPDLTLQIAEDLNVADIEITTVAVTR